MFDWQAFLDRYNIEYASAGRYHVTMGNISICCPWCHNDDGFNLHISLEGKGWHCFRVGTHRGRTPQRLIQALIKCPYSLADSLVNSSVESLPSDNDFLERLTNLFQPPRREPIRVSELHIPKGFVPIRNVGSGRMFCSYLHIRGFPVNDIPALCDKFGLLRCADDSKWHGRIIFPITINDKLVNWTGRHIAGNKLRYRSLSVEDEETPAILPINSTLLWYDRLKEARGTLVVCEGPFDALKISYLGHDQDVHATCLYGKSVSDEQRDMLERLEHFEHKIVLLDAMMVDHLNPRGAFADLRSVGFITKPLPLTAKDPGELDRDSFAQLFS
jgi:hypothetical protein